MRALVLEFPELTVEPQLPLATSIMIYRPDLVDRRHRLVLEADSWEFHTDKEAHARDCVRFTALGLAGWLVLRFSWEQVMLSPAYVRRMLAEVVSMLVERSAAA